MTTPASYEVRLTLGAEGDLQALYDHVSEYRSRAQADDLSALIETVESLERFPDRGVVPKELAALGVQDYRQILLPPYRIIYRIIDVTVYILVIADGRRDMQSLLERRLLR